MTIVRLSRNGTSSLKAIVTLVTPGKATAKFVSKVEEEGHVGFKGDPRPARIKSSTFARSMRIGLDRRFDSPRRGAPPSSALTPSVAPRRLRRFRRGLNSLHAGPRNALRTGRDRNPFLQSPSEVARVLRCR
jgi:hypothetical protein